MSVKLHPGVDTWDSRLTPLLDDEQKQLIAALAASSYERPYPSHLRNSADDKHLEIDGTNESNKGSRCDDGSNSEELQGLFDLKEPVESLPTLEKWFKGVQESILDEKEIQLSEIKEDCFSNLKIIDCLLSEVNQSQDDMQQLTSIYSQVSHQTNALHTSCEKLLEDESQLMSGVSMISEKLNSFNEYDKIMQKLNSPIFSPKSGGFNNLLQRIEECIDYLSTNPQYKESSNYLMLYKNSHSKALVMMKNYFQSTLNTAAQLQSLNPPPASNSRGAQSGVGGEGAGHSMISGDGPDVSPSSLPTQLTVGVGVGGGLGGNNSFSLLYGKFRAISSSMKVLVEQLEERQNKYIECQQILEDCESIYFSARHSLVGASVVQGVGDLLTRHKSDHCGLFRNGTFMILQVCVDEWDLFHHFFSNSESERLSNFLMSLCNHLYDALRPLIVHIAHLETLSELCSILKSEMLGDKVLSLKTRISVFEQTCKQMLEDIQERLVYRTQMYIKSDIVGYAPVAGDLAYPEKLIMMREIAQSLSKEQAEQKAEVSSDGGETSSSAAEESVDEASSSQKLTSTPNEQLNQSLASDPLTNLPGVRKDSSSSRSASGSTSIATNDISPADMHGMWYPTLRRTLVCLSKLYRCLDIDIFRGLAQETLGCCVQSLLFASNQIKAKKSETDAQLFFIKHLLILREQIQPFHSEFFVTETVLDFSKTRLAALGLLSKRERLFSLSRSNALLQFLIDGSPQVTELTVDSKKDVDIQLKKHCEIFVENCSKALCEPLMQFVEKAKVIIELKKGGQSSNSKVALRQQPFANAKKLQDVVGSTNKLIKNQLPKLKDKMSLYLANRDTEAILFRPIMSKVVKVFTDVRQLLQSYYTEEDAQIIALPTAEELKLILT